MLSLLTAVLLHTSGPPSSQPDYSALPHNFCAVAEAVLRSHSRPPLTLLTSATCLYTPACTPTTILPIKSCQSDNPARSVNTQPSNTDALRLNTLLEHIQLFVYAQSILSQTLCDSLKGSHKGMPLTLGRGMSHSLSGARQYFCLCSSNSETADFDAHVTCLSGMQGGEQCCPAGLSLPAAHAWRC